MVRPGRGLTANGGGFSGSSSYINPTSLDNDLSDNELSLWHDGPRTVSRKRKADAVDDGKSKFGTSVLRKAQKTSESSLKNSPIKQTKAKKDKKTIEKRLRRYREYPPQSYQIIAERAMTQRLCVLDRRRIGNLGEQEEIIEIAGSTGNVYTVKINQVPSCDCPHAIKGNQCKHIVYVMKRTLRAPEHLTYQLALLSSELQQILRNAPSIPTNRGVLDAASSQGDSIRKPIDDDCPICCVEFDTKEDNIVWCKAACGNNVHKDCFEKWRDMKKIQGDRVTCPFCRTRWQDDASSGNVGKGVMGPEGYRNVASDLGLSGVRDFSTYHQPWAWRARSFGHTNDDNDSDEDVS